MFYNTKVRLFFLKKNIFGYENKHPCRFLDMSQANGTDAYLTEG